MLDLHTVDWFLYTIGAMLIVILLVTIRVLTTEIKRDRDYKRRMLPV